MFPFFLMNALAITFLAAVGLLAFAGAGCSSKGNGHKPPPAGPKFSFVIRVDESLAKADFRVDVIAVNSSTRSAVESANLNDYFAPGKRDPIGLVLTNFNVTPTTHDQLRVALDKKVRFPGYSHIAIFADIPAEVKTNKLGDPRRLLLPLDGALWPPKAKEITISINSTAMRTDPGCLEQK